MKTFLFIFLASVFIFSCERKEDGTEDSGGIVTPTIPTDFWKKTGTEVDKIGDGIIVYKLFYADDGTLFAGTDSGIYRTITEGGKWKHLLNQKIEVNDFTKDNSGNIYAATANNGVYRSTDLGVTWNSFGLTGKKVWSLTKNSLGTLFAGTEDDGVFKLNEGSETWNYVALKDTAVISFTSDKTGKLFAGTYGMGVLKSVNNGITWTKTKFNFGIITSVRFDSSNTLFFSNWSDKIYKSADLGNTITPTQIGSPIYIYDIQFTKNGLIAVSGLDGITVSSNGGQNWQYVNSGLSDKESRSIAINSAGYIFAATESKGVFKSNDVILNYKNYK